MGGIIEINDTLRISKAQGFPADLEIKKHLVKPISFDVVKDKIFTFRNKSRIRVFKIPPVRNFLVEDINDKWLYWGLIHILNVHHDYENQSTSGNFRVIYLNSPEEMRQAYALIDRNANNDYFAS
jgi:hypothetical protein